MNTEVDFGDHLSNFLIVSMSTPMSNKSFDWSPLKEWLEYNLSSIPAFVTVVFKTFVKFPGDTGVLLQKMKNGSLIIEYPDLIAKKSRRILKGQYLFTGLCTCKSHLRACCFLDVCSVILIICSFTFSRCVFEVRNTNNSFLLFCAMCTSLAWIGCEPAVISPTLNIP